MARSAPCHYYPASARPSGPGAGLPRHRPPWGPAGVHGIALPSVCTIVFVIAPHTEPQRGGHIKSILADLRGIESLRSLLSLCGKVGSRLRSIAGYQPRASEAGIRAAAAWACD